MLFKKSQSAVEFMLLIAALLFIFLPLFYLLSDYSIKSNSDAASSGVLQIGQKMIDESREIFYLGRFSKEIITVNLPDNVLNMSTLIILDPSGNNEYYLIINYSKNTQMVDLPLMSEIPIVTSDCRYISSCYGGSECYYCYFNQTESYPGKKNYRLETIQWKGRTAVNITTVQWI